MDALIVGAPSAVTVAILSGTDCAVQVTVTVPTVVEVVITLGATMSSVDIVRVGSVADVNITAGALVAVPIMNPKNTLTAVAIALGVTFTPLPTSSVGSSSVLLVVIVTGVIITPVLRLAL